MSVGLSCDTIENGMRTCHRLTSLILIRGAAAAVSLSFFYFHSSIDICFFMIETDCDTVCAANPGPCSVRERSSTLTLDFLTKRRRNMNNNLYNRNTKKVVGRPCGSTNLTRNVTYVDECPNTARTFSKCSLVAMRQAEIESPGRFPGGLSVTSA